jgi:hypothetical protein
VARECEKELRVRGKISERTNKVVFCNRFAKDGSSLHENGYCQMPQEEIQTVLRRIFYQWSIHFSCC